MNNPMHVTSGTNHIAQYIQNHVSGNVAQTPSCLNCFLVKIINIITLDFLKKNKDDDYKKFALGFTFNLLHEIQKTHSRNNSYHIPHRIEFEYLNNKILFESNDKNTKEKQITKLTVATQQGETSCNTLSTEIFSQFCRIQLAIDRNILTEEEISFTAEGKPDSSKMDAATESLLAYILLDVDSLENTLQNDAHKHVQPSSSACSIPLSESCHPAQPTLLKRNTSFLYRQLSRKTSHDNSTINRGDESLKKIIYTSKEKYLKDKICEIIEKLKKTYSKDSDQRRNPESDGLFRMSGNKIENDTALVNLEKCSLDINDINREALLYVLKHNFSKINPINEKVLSKMMKNQNNATEIFHERINALDPKEKNLFLIVLEFYSDAYRSADDNTTSTFNKKQLLAASLRLTILPQLYDSITETSTDLSLIKERNNVGDHIVSNILTSFPYASDSVQLTTNQ
ncbi:hypothetical protein J5069_02655 [Candidatus Symbiopectobacterium sp. NZEC127]|uniref:hypothetical protein n=1 Tax=Candidatus Symbiopectobacterium sp. NZEC127 TaxID=2820472 RepID=UPI0022267205|nr:hypothetical protein [Candidatus Symbiopectobacterium sp. NZEC127]MCW2484790.1 hypothetical protein [Candidatus Symbiopectobacterium sp. NZEC127]